MASPLPPGTPRSYKGKVPAGPGGKPGRFDAVGQGRRGRRRSGDGAALRLAGEAAAEASPRPAERGAAPAAAPLPDAVWRPDPTYPEMLAPDLDHRQLAIFRFWNVIDRFYPYKHLIGDWDAALPEFLHRMEGDLDGRDYALTLAGVRGAKEVRLPRLRKLRYFEPTPAGEVVRVLPVRGSARGRPCRRG